MPSRPSDALDEAPGHIQEQLIDDAERGMPARQIREQVDLLLNIVEDTSSDQVVEVEDDEFADIEDTLNIDADVNELDPAIYSNIIKGFLFCITNYSKKEDRQDQNQYKNMY